VLWRVFPWDADARPGAPFSASHIPPQSGTGRFDLPLATGEGAAYLAETPEHAVGERLQDLRGRTLEDSDLIEHGRRLALVQVRVQAAVAERVADLCDPDVLAARAVRPDHLASRRRRVSQAIASKLLDDLAVTGLRWWSALDGDWHTVILFRSRVPAAELTFGTPQYLTADHLSVMLAAELLGITRR
jgi:hypothetical protein